MEMSGQKESTNQKKQEGANTHLLQAAVVLLAIVSFFTTANGMKEYIFHENDAIAYAASAAIQGILLALSMNLPGYLRGIWGKEWNLLIKVIMVSMALVLTLVTIICSSWFSYVYIAEVIHKDSWDTDSELLVQQTYRAQLYDARDYAHTYRLYLENGMGDDIVRLEAQAREQLEDSSVDFGIDWDEDLLVYASDGGTAASYMLPVITAMRNAVEIGSTQEERDQAARAVEDARSNIRQRTETIQQRLDTISVNLNTYNAQITNLTNRIRNATQGTDVEALTNSLNNYTQMFETATQEQSALALESAELDRALTRLSVYESILGLNSSTSAIAIRSSLQALQSEFFKQEPDEKHLLDIAQEIFKNLRNASNEQAAGENLQSYTALLSQMNRLIQNLTEYSDIKDLEQSLDDLIADLRTATESIGVTDDKIENAETQWKTAWGKRLSELRAQISALPLYGQSKNGENGVLSDEQLSILRDYNRNAASGVLDDMVRRYISSHNAIYQGLIYLESPYRHLALFALLLAFSFDIAGFIFGIVIEGNGRETGLGSQMLKSNFTGDNNPKIEWSTLTTLNRYVVLTGDYECTDGIYHYKVFRNGRLENWAVSDAEMGGLPYEKGIYRQDQEGSAHLLAMGQVEQMLRFSNQRAESEEQNSNPSKAEPKEGSADGVYLDCQLLFNEGSLLRVTSSERKFLTSVEEYVPVHCYIPQRGENRTIPAKRLTWEIDVQIAVVALNQAGTRVAAIYLIEK